MPKTTTKTEPTPTFEEAIARLSEIVTLLERGETPLDQSIALFEEGAKLTGHCQKLLQKAEQKVVKLTKTEENTVEEIPFEPQES